MYARAHASGKTARPAKIRFQRRHVPLEFGAIGGHAGLLKHDGVDLPRMDKQVPEKAHAQQRLLFVIAFGHGKERVPADIGAKTLGLQQLRNQPRAALAAAGVGRAALELEADEILMAIVSGEAFHRTEMIAITGLENHIL